jgi:hypothetical protein
MVQERVAETNTRSQNVEYDNTIVAKYVCSRAADIAVSLVGSFPDYVI